MTMGKLIGVELIKLQLIYPTPNATIGMNVCKYVVIILVHVRIIDKSYDNQNILELIRTYF